MFAQYTASQYVPVLCGVGDSSNELHSFGVVVNLSVQAEILLDKIVRGHELLAILVHHAGILAGETQQHQLQSIPQFSGRSSEMGKVSVSLHSGVTQDM